MKLRIEGEQATLEAKISPGIAMLLPQLEGSRSWLKSGFLRLEATGHNVSILRSLPGLTVERPTEPLRAPSAASGSPAYLSRTQAFLHQATALGRMQGRKRFALLMEQGTGKTKVAIDRAGELFCAGEITGVLIFAPKGVHTQWIEQQIPTHLGCAFFGMSWPIRTGELPSLLRPGPIGAQRPTLKFFSINIDALKTAAGMHMAEAFCVSHDFRVLIIGDETQTIKDASSQRWKAAAKIGHMCDYRLILTGTPVAKDLTDAWAQFKFLDEDILGIRYKRAFQNEYCIMGGFEHRAVVAHRNIDRFLEKITPHMFRVTQEEIGLLPPVYEKWSFDLTAEQRRLIRELKDDLLASIGSGEIEVPNAAVAIMKIQQVSNGFITDENKNVRRLFDNPADNPRVAALLDYSNAFDSPVTVWCRFREDIRVLREVLGEKCVTYFGETSTADREEAVRRFLAGEVRFFVSNASAGGVGLNLQGECKNVFYYSNSDNSIDRWQSETRTRRIGQPGIVRYTDACARGGIDRKMLRNQARKKMISQMSLGELRDWLTEEEE